MSLKDLYKKAIVTIHKKLSAEIKSWEVTDNTVEPTPVFNSLSPINDADADHYIKALTWALDNRKEKSIYNIALTGSYGSGKSSILKTFQNQNKNKDLECLEISLATFKEEVTDNNGGLSDENDVKNPKFDNSKDDEILRLIELSILQQIFYREEDKKIPDSRFKKIKSLNKNTIWWISISLLIAIVSSFYLFFPEKTTVLFTFKSSFASFLHILSLVVFIAFLFFLIFKSIRLVYGIKISKFKIKETEIEIDKSISKSILNNHLDEILYFFEVTKYSVVIIEDLDRFRRAEIFTKLRELNFLINNSKKIKKKKQAVVFIYAVRDEMFQDKDRTKFFDFIIPIIPVINSSNSKEKLAALLPEKEYKISSGLIDDIALFIDDMRLLYNICNEFHLYHQILGRELNQDKLLAMIVYKNIYPDDFVLLSNEKGFLFDTLKSRQQYISQTISELDLIIINLKNELKQIQEMQIKDANQLRMVYLLVYVNQMPGFNYFLINGYARKLLDVANDESLFDFIINNKNHVSFNSLGSYGTNQNQVLNLDFTNIEQEVDKKYGYKAKLNLINEYWNNQEETIKSKIQKLEKEKTKTRHFNLQEILSSDFAKIEIDSSTKQGLLLSLLLREGYINEDYLDYISFFYEGSITKADRTFLLSVKSQTALKHEYSLNKLGNLITKIRVIDFQQHYLLNYNLLDFMLVNSGYREQLDNVLSQLNENNTYGPEFIEGFLTTGINIEVFIKELSSKWPGIWKYISSASVLTEVRKEEYFKLIIANSRINDLKKIAELSNLTEKISSRVDFLSLIPDEERLEKIISTLNIKFKDIEIKEASEKLIYFVCYNNFYKISPLMLEKFIQKYGVFNRVTFDTSNYKAILECEIKELITYVENNINEYITDVYLIIPNNNKELEIELLRLLNNKEIKTPNLNNVIIKTETKITDITTVILPRIDEFLFKESKVKAIWQNLIEYFVRSDSKVLPPLVLFLNNIDNANELASKKINIDTHVPNLDIVIAFILALINNPNIENTSYKLILSGFPKYFYELNELNKLEDDKMKLLIEHPLIDPTLINLVDLKIKYRKLVPLFLEKSKKEILANIDSFELDAADILCVLNSTDYTPIEKQKIIDAIDLDLIIKSRDILKTIVTLIFHNRPFKVSKEIIIAALQQSFPTEDRVKLFNMHYSIFLKSDIPLIFETFPSPFYDIGRLSKTPVIPNNTENNNLVYNLKNRDFIASFSGDKNGLRINNFRKDK
jgi:hypothetical protein